MPLITGSGGAGAAWQFLENGLCVGAGRERRTGGVLRHTHGKFIKHTGLSCQAGIGTAFNLAKTPMAVLSVR